MFPFKIIFVTLLVSGLIAFLGDRIGHYVGRRKMSFLRLRPRKTATAFTIVTGMLIALLTIFILLLVSRTARTAFFGIEKLRGELGQYTKQIQLKNQEIAAANDRLAELNKSEAALNEKIKNLRAEKYALSKDVARLKEVVQELLASLKTVRGGEIFVRVGETLDTGTIPGGTDGAEAEKIIKDMLSRADSQLRLRSKILGREVPLNERIIWLSQEELGRAKTFIKTHPGTLAVRVNAGHNAAAGEQVVVHFEIFENRLIYKKNTTILEVKVPAGLKQPELEKRIQAALVAVRQAAEKNGLLPDRRGSVGSVSYEKLFGLIGEIKKVRFPGVVLKIKAGDNIFTSGPLELTFQIDKARGE